MDQHSIKHLGLRFFLSSDGRPNVSTLSQDADSPGFRLADFLRGDVQSCTDWARELLDRIREAKRNPNYSWRGTANASEIQIDAKEVILHPLYDQYPTACRFSLDVFAQALQAWLHLQEAPEQKMGRTR